MEKFSDFQIYFLIICYFKFILLLIFVILKYFYFDFRFTQIIEILIYYLKYLTYYIFIF